MRKSLANYYAEDMYERDRTRDSARILVPMAVELFNPSSVVDVGCGRAAGPGCVSAGPPGQGGEGHINCQPLSYWRKIFGELGFRMLDPFRPRLRDDRRVAWWYRQNAVLFVSPDAIAGNPALKEY